jgi:molybdopterin/thiamine biosynthesis adenylyltransferase
MSVAADRFDYFKAFSRNIGWVTSSEQRVLRAKRVAIAGLGGVGGAHLVTLARLGIGAFNISDFDSFDVANLNRQVGATVSTLDRSKVEVLAEMAAEINPTLDIKAFPEGVTPANLRDFLRGVDLFVDGFDFFALEARKATFAACRALGIPAITAAPLGMGAALLVFLPGGMSFDDYFRLDDVPSSEQALRFLLGLSPALLQRSYLLDRSTVDFSAQRGPSTVMACQLCAGLAATEGLKILLKRGKVLDVPHSIQYDAYRHRLVRVWRPWGNRNPLQQVALAVARRQLRRATVDLPRGA